MTDRLRLMERERTHVEHVQCPRCAFYLKHAVHRTMLTNNILPLIQVTEKSKRVLESFYGPWAIFYLIYLIFYLKHIAAKWKKALFFNVFVFCSDAWGNPGLVSLTQIALVLMVEPVLNVSTLMQDGSNLYFLVLFSFSEV